MTLKISKQCFRGPYLTYILLSLLYEHPLIHTLNASLYVPVSANTGRVGIACCTPNSLPRTSFSLFSDVSSHPGIVRSCILRYLLALCSYNFLVILRSCGQAERMGTPMKESFEFWRREGASVEGMARDNTLSMSSVPPCVRHGDKNSSRRRPGLPWFYVCCADALTAALISFTYLRSLSTILPTRLLEGGSCSQGPEAVETDTHYHSRMESR